MSESRPPEHFTRLYEANDDPWNFATSQYERAKYRHTMQVLGQRHFVSGLELGCSVGVLTRMLAERCDQLLGIDVVAKPLESARARCARYRWVRFQQMQVPHEWPKGQFNLIVMSEVLYFLSAGDVARCAARSVTSLHAGGIVVLVNWLGRTDDPLSGDEAAERFIADSALRVVHRDRRMLYRLDVLMA